MAKTKDSTRTPGPWKVERSQFTTYLTTDSLPHIHFATVEKPEDAAFMVHMENTHDQLLKALEDVTKWADAVIGEPDKAMGEQTYGNKVIKAAVAAIEAAS